MPMSDAVHARPKIVGARVKRTEDPRLLTGRGSFVDDRPAALHVAFRRSEHSHARIKAIECGAARKADGVVAVFTAEDLAATERDVQRIRRLAVVDEAAASGEQARVLGALDAGADDLRPRNVGRVTHRHRRLCVASAIARRHARR